MRAEKLNEKDKELIEKAREILVKARKNASKKIGEVGCALISKKGNYYFGVCAELYCGLGGCAEKAAILNMITKGETEISTIVAVTEDKILPPCGVCRETILQVNKRNLDTNVIISNSKKVKLKELLPYSWQEISGLW